MKRIILGTTLLALTCSAGLWAHHMAEGIISAELWEQIDLAIADTPHNEMLDAAGSTMEIEEDVDSGVVYLVTDVPYEFDDTSEFPTAEDAIEDLLDGYVVPATDAMNRIPTGTVIVDEDEFGSRTTYVTYTVDYDSEGDFISAVITTYEPIGRGESQEVDKIPAPSKGKR